jgi:hypothetical protein
MTISRRSFIAALPLMVALTGRARAAARPTITVYKSPT